jgi:membrane fusion protein
MDVMKNDLIRQEYIENKKIIRSGSIVAATDFTWFPFFFLFLVFFLVLIYFLIFLDYTRRINVYGELTTFPHSINIFTPQQGFVTRKYVDVGEFVEKGQKLYKIDVSKVT